MASGGATLKSLIAQLCTGTYRYTNAARHSKKAGSIFFENFRLNPSLFPTIDGQRVGYEGEPPGIGFEAC